LTVNGATRFSGAADTVVTVGSQSYGGAVVLANDPNTGAWETVNLTSNNGGTVSFGGPINAQTPGLQAMWITSTSAVVFNGSVGATSPLYSLITAGTTYLGGDVKTIDEQNYQGNVLLTASVTLSSANSSISATGSINSQGTPKSVSFVANGPEGHVSTTALGDVGPLDLVSISQTADVITQVVTNNFARIAISTPGSAKVTTSASSYVIESITVGEGETVELTAVGSVTQNGPILASSLLLTNRDAASFTLTNPGNRIGVVAGAANSLSLTNGGGVGLTVGSVDRVEDQTPIPGLTIVNGLTLTQNGGGDLLVSEAISAGRASLSASGRIEAPSATVAVADGPLEVAANGGVLQNVTVNGQTGPVDGSFVRVVSGSIEVNSIAVVAPVVSEPPATPTIPPPTSAPVLASGPSVASAPSVSSQPTPAEAASVASLANAPERPDPQPIIVLADLRPSAAASQLSQDPGLLARIVTPLLVFTAPKLELSSGSQIAATITEGGLAAAGGLVSATPSGGLIPVLGTAVPGSGAPLASAPTVKVDQADTGGVGGQVIAAFGASGGQSRVILRGLLIDSTVIPGRRREEDEPLLSQQPSQMNEEYLLD
jgi:hypothetical protein